MRNENVVTWKAKIKVFYYESFAGTRETLLDEEYQVDERELIVMNLRMGRASGCIWRGEPDQNGNVPTETWEARIKIKDNGVPIDFYDLNEIYRYKILNDLADAYLHGDKTGKIIGSAYSKDVLINWT